MNVEHFVASGAENYHNFVEAGPATDLDIGLAVNEFDKALRSTINFADPEAFKALILPLGLEELRAVVAYELMNLQILIVAVRTNQVQMDNLQRKLSEIGFLEPPHCFVVANPVLDVMSRLTGPSGGEAKLQQMPAAERSAVMGSLTGQVSKGYYHILSRKTNKKETVERTFKLVRNALQAIRE